MKTFTFLFAFTFAVCWVNAQQIIKQTTTTVTTYITQQPLYDNCNNWSTSENVVLNCDYLNPANFGYVNVNMNPYLNQNYSSCNYTRPILHTTQQQLAQPTLNVITTSENLPLPHINAPNNSEFNIMLQSIANQTFEQNKLQIAHQILISNYLTSQQIYSILRLFTFESTKLSFSKSAFNKVLDPQNYFIINNAFSFSSSVNDLNNYLMGF
jgi:hypothetical protein